MGWDLSMKATGIAMPDGSTALIKPKGAGDARLLNLEMWATEALRVARPDLGVIEDVQGAMIGAANKVIPMVHATVRLCFLRAGVPYVVVNPSTLKTFVTGDGSADKDRMAAAALERAGRTFAGDPGGDQCDAWWLRAAGHAAYGAPVVNLPAAHLEALHVVAWPRIPGARPPIEHVPVKKPARRRKPVPA
ncbi:hypothetical protein [Streptomyces sp. NPDC001781]